MVELNSEKLIELLNGQCEGLVIHYPDRLVEVMSKDCKISLAWVPRETSDDPSHWLQTRIECSFPLPPPIYNPWFHPFTIAVELWQISYHLVFQRGDQSVASPILKYCKKFAIELEGDDLVNVELAFQSSASYSLDLGDELRVEFMKSATLRRGMNGEAIRIPMGN